MNTACLCLLCIKVNFLIDFRLMQGHSYCYFLFLYGKKCFLDAGLDILACVLHIHSCSGFQGVHQIFLVGFVASLNTRELHTTDIGDCNPC